MSDVYPSTSISLSIQILQAHYKWNKLRHDFDIMESMYEVLKAREVEAGIKSGLAVTRSEVTVKGSDWNMKYRLDMNAAKKAMFDAQAAHAYLIALAQEQS